MSDRSEDRRTPLSERLRESPWWVLVPAGVVAVLLGLTIALRPFAALSTLLALVVVTCLVNGVAELASVMAGQEARSAVAGAVCWLVTAVAVLSWPGLGLRALTVVIGGALVVAGLARGVAAVRGTTDERAAAVLLGLAEIVFGVLALAIPDVTLLVVAVVFGSRTAMFGVSLLITAWSARRSPTEAARRPGPGVRRAARRWLRVLAAATALVVAFGLFGVAYRLRAAQPVVDAFYSAPADVPDRPGVLLRHEAFTTAVPADADAWRILYTTSRADGVPALASAVVLAAKSRPSGPRPVVAWAHGTTGFAQNCAPTLLRNGFAAGALPALDQIVANGWVLVATDYVGLGTAGPHPYLVGVPAARSVLDAVRAARGITEVEVGDRTVVWGHSQGGGAALWTGGIAPVYAPDVPLAGVAALAPASDLPALVGNLDRVPGGGIFASFVVAGYAATYPDVDVDASVRPEAQVFVREIAARCLAEPEVLLSVGSSLAFDGSIFAGSPAAGALGRRLGENVPTLPIAAPLLIAQGAADALVLPERQAAYAKRLCAAGQKLDYRTYPGRDHVGVVAADSPLVPDLVRWTTERFAGLPAASTC